LGKNFIRVLYGCRSVSKAIPQFKDQKSVKSDVYKIALEILTPEIKKSKDLMKFCNICSQTLYNMLKDLINEYKDGFASQEFLSCLSEFLNLVLVIDTLKNAKSSLNNDFSMYKRMQSHAKIPGTEEETIENSALYMFLGKQNVFASTIKEKLATLNGVDDILIDMVNHCVNMFENNTYITHKQKHTILRVNYSIS
jgi:cytoplasmic FMR1 interacting protein